MPAARVRYQTIEFGEFGEADAVDIHIRTLRDNQQFEDDDGVAEALGISSATWPLFGVMWGSGRALADLMFDYAVDGRRVLEVGCGIGLASLVLNHHEQDITATDIHPKAGPFLRHNVEINCGRPIPFVRTSWADEEDPRLGRFDLIIGSDVLYEGHHPGELSEFIDRHSEATAEVLIIDPRRGEGRQFSKHMVAAGFDSSRTDLEAQLEGGQTPKRLLTMLRFTR